MNLLINNVVVNINIKFISLKQLYTQHNHVNLQKEGSIWCDTLFLPISFPHSCYTHAMCTFTLVTQPPENSYLFISFLKLDSFISTKYCIHTHPAPLQNWPQWTFLDPCWKDVYIGHRKDKLYKNDVKLILCTIPGRKREIFIWIKNIGKSPPNLAISSTFYLKQYLCMNTW